MNLSDLYQGIRKSLIHSGIQHADNEYERQRIIFSNIISMLLNVLASGFLAITLVEIPDLAWLVVLAVLSYSSVPLLNNFGYTRMAVVTGSVVVPVFLSVYHCYLIQAGEPVLIAILTLQTALILVPWTIIGLRYRSLLATCVAICIASILFVVTSNDYFNMELDNSIFRDSYMYYGSIATAVLTIVITMLYLSINQNQNNYFIKNTAKAIESKKELLAQNDRKLQEYNDRYNKEQARDEAREWATRGLSELHAIQRKFQNDEERLFDEVLSCVIRYTGAGLGILFTTNEERTGIIIRSCYAINKKKFVGKYIYAGKFGAGQAFLEKQTIVMSDVPDTYHKLASGMGSQKPATVVLEPMLNDRNEVVGVIELAFAKIPDKKVMGFIEKSARDMAGSLSYINNSIRTHKLLEEGQMLTEQMQAQEEEMRQNMEEMAATQEEMARTEQQYQQEINRLKAQLNKSRQLA